MVSRFVMWGGLCSVVLFLWRCSCRSIWWFIVDSNRTLAIAVLWGALNVSNIRWITGFEVLGVTVRI